jgi:integrase
LGDFVERQYLPHIDEQKKPSTRRGYHQIWSEYLQPRPQIFKAWLREVRTVNVQGWLRAIAMEHRSHCPRHRCHTDSCDDCKDRRLSKPTLQHIKHFMSGVFRFAAQQGFRDGAPNPVREASIPAGLAPAREAEAYSLEEINVLMHLFGGSVPGTAIALFAYGGFRAGEVKGLEWSDYIPPNDDAAGLLHVRRSIWKTFSTDPKTEKSKAPVPVIPQLAEQLNAHRKLHGNPLKGPILANAKGKPLSLDWLAGAHVKPVLRRCAVCREPKSKHNRYVDHEFQLDASLPRWKGWKGFRTALASNLNRLGIDDHITQRILRHSNVGTTQKHYIKTVDQDSILAMKAFSDAVATEEKNAATANCSPNVPQNARKRGKSRASSLLQ